MYVIKSDNKGSQKLEVKKGKVTALPDASNASESQKGMGKLQNHLQNCASRTQYLEASNTEPAGTCSSMNTVTHNPCDMSKGGQGQGLH